MTIREFEQNQSQKTMVNGFDSSNTNFLIEHFGFEHTSPDKPASYGHTLFSLHFIVKGSLTLSYNGKEHNLSKNTVFLVPPNKSVKYTVNPQNPASYYWCAVTGSSASHFFRIIGFSENKLFIPLAETSAKKIRESFFMVLTLQNELKNIAHLYMNESLCRIAKTIYLSQLQANTVLSPLPTLSPTMMKVVAYIQEHYTDSTLTLQRIAKELFLHPDYLSVLFKKEVGMNFKNYLTNKRIHYADILIRQGENNVSVIADKVGFPDASYFTKIYRKINLSTPSSDIAQQREKNLSPIKKTKK